MSAAEAVQLLDEWLAESETIEPAPIITITRGTMVHHYRADGMRVANVWTSAGCRAAYVAGDWT